MRSPSIGKAALEKGRLWGSRACDWAELQEPLAHPAYERVFERLRVTADANLLDVGCGAGLALQMAAGQGALVAGIDAAEGLLTIARERVPGADLRVGDMTALPWPAHTFDVVIGFNTFQFAANPIDALREAKRVSKSGGRVGIITWGSDEECEAVAHVKALQALMPASPPRSSDQLGDEQSIAIWARHAGLTISTDELVDCPWRYHDLTTALRALTSAGPAARAIERAGADGVENALTACLAQFAQPDGSYLLRNKLRALTATV